MWFGIDLVESQQDLTNLYKTQNLESIIKLKSNPKI